MNEREIIAKSIRLLEGKDISVWEDFKDYHEARDLLLDNGFIRGKNEELQKAYHEIFPSNKSLEKELNGVLKEIQSKDEIIKLKASKFLEKAPREEVGMDSKLWLKEPKTIEILCNALENESNEKVMENLILCLGNIASRYGYDDIAVFERIVSKYEKSSNSLKIIIAQSCCKYLTDRKWMYVYDVLSFKSKKVIVQRLLPNIIRYSEELKLCDDWLSKIKSNLYETVSSNKNVQIQTKFIRAVMHLSSIDDIDSLKNIIKNNTLKSPLSGNLEDKINELSNTLV
ncbi:hypothetical protein LNJ08_11920 [Tenacibaculum finnmarkense genomovar ulcerans]|uniref:hypothetical protein n=1 Tax=Tenacibaculum finnmarkense TaxID=2781243 RepID=UPI001E2DECB1|nr:hypothetical protein [Tenacibaculum finnmarkense]MCD8455097.1 hypothetical protein [Tenacibaculum finnmarkense genomovar ulcerans]